MKINQLTEQRDQLDHDISFLLGCQGYDQSLLARMINERDSLEEQIAEAKEKNTAITREICLFKNIIDFYKKHRPEYVQRIHYYEGHIRTLESNYI